MGITDTRGDTVVNWRNNWKQILLRTASYLLVAALASFGTMLIFGQNTKLVELERVIRSRFVGDVDTAAMEDAAAEAMVNALGDRWSYYISADEYAAYENRKTNTYVGIGVTILAREDGAGFDIIAVQKDGSAEKAGILPGDILIEADGQSLAGMGSGGPSQIIKGEEGTKVTIAVLRNGEKLTFELKRKRVDSVVTTGQMLEGNIGYIRINNFNDHCAEETLAVMNQLLDQGAQKLLFDLRNNPGGYLQEMNEILDTLLPEGVLLRTVDHNGTEEIETSDAACMELPMAVLVNAESYSAAEFFAAALQEYDWATVVGEPTSGKGYFQNTFRFQDGSAVGLSVGQYYTPKGISLAESGGLKPDVVVEVDDITRLGIYAQALPLTEDPQVLAAIETLE